MPAKKQFDNKTFLIFHYRTGLTDGVSLEIAIWQKILTDLGARVLLVAGPGSIGADFEVPLFNYRDDPKIFAIDDWAFSRNDSAFKDDSAFQNSFAFCKNSLYQNFKKIIDQTKPDWAIVSNVFSLGENLPAAAALKTALEETKTKALLVHHDFYWGHGRCANPKTPFIQKLLDDNYPPQNSRFEHACINSLARDDLYRKKGIRSMIITDSVDFHRPLQDRGAQCAKLLEKFGVNPNDLIILQATRLAPRKAVEIAVDFVKELQSPKNLHFLSDKGLYNRRGFNPKSDRVVLVMAGYAEKQDQDYKDRLANHVKAQKINVCFLDGKAGGFTPLDRGPSDKPTLLDLYIYADLVTYPSFREGFGNQFLEAILSKTPIALFEYPVFKADIKPKGFKFISLGDKYDLSSQGLAQIPPATLSSAVSESLDILTNPDLYTETVEENYQIGKNNYSTEKIADIFTWIFSGTWLKRKVGYHQHGKPMPLISKWGGILTSPAC